MLLSLSAEHKEKLDYTAARPGLKSYNSRNQIHYFKISIVVNSTNCNTADDCLQYVNKNLLSLYTEFILMRRPKFLWKYIFLKFQSLSLHLNIAFRETSFVGVTFQRKYASLIHVQFLI